MVDNKTLKVSLAQKLAGTTGGAAGGGGGSGGLQQSNLYVANLPKHYTKTELEQLFLPYGALLETKILLGVFMLLIVHLHVSFHILCLRS